MPPRESIHVQRAKRWETNPFLAEWFDRTVKHCKGPGKTAFESWLVTTHGREKANRLISECKFTPHLLPVPKRKYAGKGLENLQNWNKASVELGVTDEAMKTYFGYASWSDCCTPERTLPAPKRRRHESSSQWIARRNAALLEGHKKPNFDWESARAIAISELDRARDTAILRRSHLQPFMDEMQRRALSTIPSPEIVALGEEVVRHRTWTDALRSTTFISHLSHRCWKHATDVFEYLARNGLCTASAIERAYLKDEDLMWRLFACGVMARTLTRELWGKVAQVVTFCEHYRPYFKRWRTNRGVAQLEINRNHWRTHGLKTELDCYIVNHMASDSDSSMFYSVLMRELAAHPEEAAKFSEEAFEIIGDHAVVDEFLEHFLHTPFGTNLRKCALEKAGNQMHPGMFKYLCPLDPQKLDLVTALTKPVTYKAFGQACTLDSYIISQWHNNEIELGEAINDVIRHGRTLPVLIAAFQTAWEFNDRILWNAAKYWDRPDQPGRVAREFGLLDPKDPNRPSYTRGLFQLLGETPETPAPAASVKEEYVHSFPVAAAGEGIMSGHAYTKETEPSRPKNKSKTTGTTEPTTVKAPPEPVLDQTLDDFPDILPRTFKLPKKILKVFHNILEVERDKTDDANAPKRGTVRWGDFEKAMKRLGFDIIQTAGSSVRFDPPARTARPISFHRPHPDSVLPPHMLKVVGARLKRTYGWTTGTFDLAPSSSED
ncbi:hypothetical protein C8J56DRAFT_935771 [Mycena floridula]|nr:hypothetical protein C8J56DRAFT_935771 [Mycena floridula]